MTKTLEIKNAPAPAFVFQVGWGEGANVIENWWVVGGSANPVGSGKKVFVF